ncbi:MAG: OsmC family protein [Ferruginibacter sp.]
MNKHFITSSYVAGMAFSASIYGHKIIMDTPDEGGSDSGPSPKKLILASLAGCTGIDVVSILNKMKVPFSDLTINVEAGLTDEHPKIYKDVIINYSIKLAMEDRSKMERAVNLSQEKYCGVSAMFRAFTTVESVITYI